MFRMDGDLDYWKLNLDILSDHPEYLNTETRSFDHVWQYPTKCTKQHCEYCIAYLISTCNPLCIVVTCLKEF